MALYEHTYEIAGQPVVDWNAAEPDFEATAYRIALSYDDADGGEKWIDHFAGFLDTAPLEQVSGLVIGAWEEMFDANGSANEIVEALVAARERLPHLRALFFGDIISEECEISWIQQTDISPLFSGYPQLEYFRVRGGNGLQIGALNHTHLRTLIIETGGLDAAIVQAVASAELPALEHLEIWLGTENYGATSTIQDVLPILMEGRFPQLRYLGLRNSDLTDEIAKAVIDSPILTQLEVLDLSLGILRDEGAQALVASPEIRLLKKLDVHHHFCSDEMMEKLGNLGIEVDMGEQESADDYGDETYYYVAVGE